MNLKKLALVAAIAAASTGVHAGWDSGVSGNTGELMLVVWDNDTSDGLKSVWQDLGLQVSDFIANVSDASYTESVSLDAAAFSIFDSSDAANLEYSIVGFRQGGGRAFGNAAVVTALEETGLFLTQLNPQRAPLDSIVLASDATATSENNAFQGTNAGNFAGDEFVWGELFRGSVPQGASANVADAIDFFLAEQIGPSQVYTEFAGDWTIDLTGGTVDYNAAAIPVPAAAWLFGSAVLGLVAARRRS